MVKSSLASSMVGFIRGGKFGSLPLWRPSADTSTVLVYAIAGRESVIRKQASSSVSSNNAMWMWWAYLAILKLEHKGDLVSIYRLVDDLRGHPALSRVGLPCSGAHIVALRHGVGGLVVGLCGGIVVMV